MQLKECPFCKDEERYVVIEKKIVFVECQGCGSRGPTIDFVEEESAYSLMYDKAEEMCIKRWNRRSKDE